MIISLPLIKGGQITQPDPTRKISGSDRLGVNGEI